MSSTSSKGNTWISRMRTTASAFCNVLHREGLKQLMEAGEIATAAEGGKTAQRDQPVDTARNIRFLQVTRRPGQVRPARRIGLCCCRSAAASLTHHDRPLANVVAVQLPDSIRNRNFFRNIDVRKTGRRS